MPHMQMRQMCELQIFVVRTLTVLRGVPQNFRFKTGRNGPNFERSVTGSSGTGRAGHARAVDKVFVGLAREFIQLGKILELT